MTNFGQLLRGGDSGAMISPGKGMESLLVKKLLGTGDGNQMPQGRGVCEVNDQRRGSPAKVVHVFSIDFALRRTVRRGRFDTIRHRGGGEWVTNKTWSATERAPWGGGGFLQNIRNIELSKSWVVMRVPQEVRQQRTKLQRRSPVICDWATAVGRHIYIFLWPDCKELGPHWLLQCSASRLPPSPPPASRSPCAVSASHADFADRIETPISSAGPLAPDSRGQTAARYGASPNVAFVLLTFPALSYPLTRDPHR